MVAGKCRNRTYQPTCDGLSGFEDRAGHQTRTLPYVVKSPWLRCFNAFAIFRSASIFGDGSHSVAVEEKLPLEKIYVCLRHAVPKLTKPRRD